MEIALRKRAVSDALPELSPHGSRENEAGRANQPCPETPDRTAHLTVTLGGEGLPMAVTRGQPPDTPRPSDTTRRYDGTCSSRRATRPTRTEWRRPPPECPLLTSASLDRSHQPQRTNLLVRDRREAKRRKNPFPQPVGQPERDRGMQVGENFAAGRTLSYF